MNTEIACDVAPKPTAEERIHHPYSPILEGMKLIYIAGPFRNPTEWGIHKNVRHAEEAAAKVWKLGHAALCPHKNTEHFSGICPDENFLNGDLRMLKGCDAVFLCSGWSGSSGSIGEVRFAESNCIPVFYEWAFLQEWLTENL